MIGFMGKSIQWVGWGNIPALWSRYR